MAPRLRRIHENGILAEFLERPHECRTDVGVVVDVSGSHHRDRTLRFPPASPAHPARRRDCW